MWLSESLDFDPSARDASIVGLSWFHVIKHVAWTYDVIKLLPVALVERLVPVLAPFLALKRASMAQVEEIRAGANVDWQGRDHPTIFHAILDSKVLPPREKATGRLAEDAQVLVMTGTLTVTFTLELVTFWLLRQPATLRRLKEELRAAMPSVRDDVGAVLLAALEGLPYLTAVVKEGLRLSYGLAARSQRIDPDRPLVFVDKSRCGKEWTIPPGTSVSMTSAHIHHNEDIFPDSHRFVAERWLGDAGRRLDKYMVSFSKGSRNCLGANLAYGEMYLALAYMWRRWGSSEATVGDEVGLLALFETGVRDVEMEADHFIPMPQKGSKGVRLLATRRGCVKTG